MMTAVEGGVRAGPDGVGVPLRPLGVAELLDGAARLVRRNARASFAITLPVEVVRTVLVTLLAYASLDTLRDGDAATAATGGGLALPALLLQLFAGSLAGTLLSGLLAPLYTEDVLGGRLTTAQTLSRVGARWLPLAAMTVVVAFGLEVGVVALVVGGVWLWGVWALAGPALVTERLGPLRAVRRSLDLVRYSFWRVWGVRALAWLVVTVLSAFVTVPVSLLALFVGGGGLDEARVTIDNPTLYLTITALGALLVGVLFAPFRAAVDALLYLDMRMRREGLDLTVALDADEKRTVTPTAPQPSW